MEPSPFALDLPFLLLAAFVVIGFTAGAATGFGSMVIALTLGAQLYPIPDLLPVLVPLSVGLTAFMVLRHRSHVDLRLLVRRVFPLMVPGMALGFVAFATAPAGVLTRLLGVFVVGVTGAELAAVLMGRRESQSPLGRLPFATAAIGAGVIQGAAASGGPVLVYALGRLGLPKAIFRATLAVVWLCLNTALVITYIATGRLDAGNAPFVALLIPAVVGAVVLGEWLHHRLDEGGFRNLVLVLLAGAGMALVV